MINDQKTKKNQGQRKKISKRQVNYPSGRRHMNWSYFRTPFPATRRTRLPVQCRDSCPSDGWSTTSSSSHHSPICLQSSTQLHWISTVHPQLKLHSTTFVPLYQKEQAPINAQYFPQISSFFFLIYIVLYSIAFLP